jgi:site-specific recombinase XerD
VSQAFARSVDRLGLNAEVTDRRQMITFHSLRHSFASWLALQGESLVVIRELMGHKSFEMTKRYAHLIPDRKRKATLNLEKVFNKRKDTKEIFELHD